MRYHNIEQFITQFPIYQYEIIDSSEIVFNDKAGKFCKKECSRYGTSWSCQPAIGKVEKCKAKCLKFPKALLFSSIANVSDDAPEIMKCQRNHLQVIKRITRFLSVNNILNYALSTDACLLCEKCSYPKKACIRPDSMIPCIESHGIELIDLAEKHHMDYWLDDNIKIWFGLIFLAEE